MKAAWKGYITIGQLGMPVRLYSATRTAGPTFKLVHEKDGSPVERVLRCQAEDREIPYNETIRAIEYEPGRLITFTPRELERTALEHSKSIEVKQFADPTEIDPSYYEKPYYIVPSRGGERAYSLLREALNISGKVAVVQFVIYNQDHIGIIRKRDDVLMLHQLRFAGEVVPRSEIKTPPLPKASPAEINALTELIERYSGSFFPEDYHNEHAANISHLLERKIKGLPAPRRESKPAQATAENDLLPAIRLSLESGEKHDG